MPKLCDLTCRACRGEAAILTGDQLQKLHTQLDSWDIIGGHHLSKTYRFRNFVLALEFVNQLGQVAQQQAHHPDIHLSWGRVKVEIWTHKVDGLTENDFILAAKFDERYSV